MGDRRRYEMSDYPWWLFTRIAAHVEAGSHDDAHADLDRALDRMDHEHGPDLGPRTMRCSAVLSHALRGAYSGGAPSEPILITYMETLDTLAAAPDWEEVRRVMHESFDGLLEKVSGDYRGDVDELVAAIRATIRNEPGAVRSLADYARTHHLHPDHLSRRFHTIAGQTFTAERRHFRILVAQELLRSTTLKVRAVAHQVGYNDPSRFIADFRSLVGETPATYRKATAPRAPLSGSRSEPYFP